MDTVKVRGKVDKRGSVLPLAVLIVVLLVLIGLALIRLGLNARMQTVRMTLGISARSAADAGLAEAVGLMREKLEAELVWNQSIFPYTASQMSLAGNPYGNAKYDFTITGDPNSAFIISSTGNASTINKTVYCRLGLGSLRFGIAVKDRLNVNAWTNFGTVPSPDGDFRIQTNSTADGAIQLKANVVVPGDVVVGPGSDPSKVVGQKQSTTILGDTYAALNPIDFPSITVPPELVALPPTSYTHNPSGLTGDIKFNTWALANGKLQEITGQCRIFVVGDMTMNNGAEILIDPGASLTLYLNGQLEDKNSSGITNATNDSTKFTLYGTDNCVKVDLKAKSDFYGSIYTPNADLTLFNGGDVVGAIAGCTNLVIKNSGSFYFDTRLLTVWVDDPLAYFVIERWWEI
ncbi:MAG: hypothetical protein JXB29_10700 [Sedimentisphaerales bacterium]|nr:hypothetical protein [Sedimentisphaerales bacterium]